MRNQRRGWAVVVMAALWAPAGAGWRAERAAAATAREQADRAADWRAAVSDALDDERLVAAVERVTTPVAGVGRRSAPLARAQLLAWAVTVHRSAPNVPLADALRAALAEGRHDADPEVLGLMPEPPHARLTPTDLTARLAGCIDAGCDDDLGL